MRLGGDQEPVASQVLLDVNPQAEWPVDGDDGSLGHRFPIPGLRESAGAKVTQ